MQILGLKNCDSTRRALARHAPNGAVLRDIRANPLRGSEIAAIIAMLGEAAINRRSSTWRGLDAAERALDPVALLATYPALMKRPVILQNGCYRFDTAK